MKIIEAKELLKPISIAIVVSRFNAEVTDALLEGAVERLKELEVPIEKTTIVHVPGAIEIPLVIQRLAETKHYDVAIALGAVIRGETDHYAYVCEQVSQGCQQVMLAHNLPVIFGILTTDDESQAEDRIGGRHGHKGREAADAAIEMISILEQLG